MAKTQTKRPARFSLSAPRGGEGRGEVGRLRVAPNAHLTLPLLCNGPLPLPPKGGEGSKTV